MEFTGNVIDDGDAEIETEIPPIGVKVAVQVFEAFIVTEPAAEQSPDQPLNTEPASGVAVTFTTVPELYVPAPVTFPVPVPALVTVREWEQVTPLGANTPRSTAVLEAVHVKVTEPELGEDAAVTSAT